jgi:hypothetical protein
MTSKKQIEETPEKTRELINQVKANASSFMKKETLPTKKVKKI